ncbi:MAG TPA: tRNA (adenosine(37)-N6)-threonylcarbamoyltransferase complex ATPase subunit type 1 TsaE [Acidimicrobiales bacterium]|nr:tRNA (adenosine(37)-N6)-threonylcarbamoyltransferase complex ATPase subunit type 1 TsaE [Acidimicrobiales bacterium]
MNDGLLAITSSPEDTRALATGIAGLARAGDIFVLVGELGTGKTVWVQGFARGLGVAEPVTSPTFTLLRPYKGDRLTLLHADLYRLEELSEINDLDLLEQLDGRAVACIEWGEFARPVLPANLLEVRFDFGAGDEERTIALHPVGASWAARVPELAKVVSPWSAAG